MELSKETTKRKQLEMKRIFMIITSLFLATTLWAGSPKITTPPDDPVASGPAEEIILSAETKTLRDYITPVSPITKRASLETRLPYYVYGGQPLNRYLWCEYRDVLDLILVSLYDTFKGTRESPWTGVYDACGSAEHLPAGSHAFSKVNGRTVDLSYWMLKGDNFTQQWNIPKEYKWNQLWKTDQIDTHFVKTFDWERLYCFAVRAREVLPNISITVDRRIRDFLLQRVRHVYGREEEAKLTFLYGDAPKNYNHHQHMHIVLDIYRPVINWDADITHWRLGK